MLAAVSLQEGNRGRSGAAGGQHGVQNDHVPLGDIAGHLAVVLHRLMSLGVPVQADMAHLGGGNQIQNAVHHAKARPEDGDNGQLLARQVLEGPGGNGGLDDHILQGQVTGSLIALQGGDFGNDLPKLLHAGRLVTEDG